MGDSGGIEATDARLVVVAAEEAALRLRLGQALDIVHRLGHCFALGFSSFGAYALERCDRSVRWAEAARCLARRLDELPVLRRATAAGLISWSMAELVAREATTKDEVEWVALARAHTLREMRHLVNARHRNAAHRRSDYPKPAYPKPAYPKPAYPKPEYPKPEYPKPECQKPVCYQAGCRGSDSATNEAVSVNASAAALNPAGVPSEPAGLASEHEDEAQCTLTCTLTPEDLWLFEATRALLERLGTHGGNDQAEALLAEGQATLLAALPHGTVEIDESIPLVRVDSLGGEALHRQRSDAELAAERQLPRQSSKCPMDQLMRSGMALDAAMGTSSLSGGTALELDSIVRTLSKSLAEHEFVFAQLLLEFHRREGWRTLGLATEVQYARERLGLSRSSLLARRALAARLQTLPATAEALRTGRIGVEAASQVVRVAAPTTEVAWVERAQQRTVKHLREEVVAALTAVRVSGDADCPPPLDAELARFEDLERAVLSGRLWREPSKGGGDADTLDTDTLDADTLDTNTPSPQAPHPRRAWRTMLTSLGAWLTGGVQISASRVSPGQRALAPNADSDGRRVQGSVVVRTGRVELRLKVSLRTRAWWRGLEQRVRRWLPRGTSWMRFLCLAIWRDWHHLLGVDVAYGGIYLRDRCRCASPVCNRRDVTPHHLRFRSAGGDDSAGNLTALCSWCHLFGVHGGRIRAQGEAPLIRWDLGAPLTPCLSVYGRDRLP
jgi:hypothetical protein